MVNYKQDITFETEVKLSQKVMSKKIEIVKVNNSGDMVGYNITTIDSYFYLNGSGESDGATKGERALSHSFIMDSFRKLMGKTLTLIDASVTSPVQNKAIKDCIRQIFNEEITFSSEMAFDQKELQKMADEHFEGMSDEEIEKSAISIDEVLGVK